MRSMLAGLSGSFSSIALLVADAIAIWADCGAMEASCCDAGAIAGRGRGNGTAAARTGACADTAAGSSAGSR